MKRLVIKHPIITEKAVQGSAIGTYVFKVTLQATKPEIRKAMKEAYNTDVIDIRIIRTKPKARRLGRSLGIKPGYKKAMVRLPAGKKLDILPQ